MTHYQKNAAIAFRITGTVLILFSSLAFFPNFITSFGRIDLVLLVLSPYFIGGLILIVSSRILARLVCFDFGESSEK